VEHLLGRARLEDSVSSGNQMDVDLKDLVAAVVADHTAVAMPSDHWRWAKGPLDAPAICMSTGQACPCSLQQRRLIAAVK
jgi:hypothetical protein